MTAGTRAEVPRMDELVTVRAFTAVIDAQVACAVLQSAGLDASLRDEHVVSMQWLFSNAVGGVKLQVPADQVDIARAMLDAPASIDHTSGGTAAHDACPHCGGSRAESVLWGRQPAVVTWLLMGVPLFPIRRLRRCASCGTALAWGTPQRRDRHPQP
jgi:hypothetical protein